MTLAQGIEIGPFSFSVIRILIAIAAIRIFIRGEWLILEFNGIDWMMIIWAIWAVITGLFHKGETTPIIYRLGLVFNTCGIYFILRFLFQSIDELVGLFSILSILLFPIALEMIYEQIASHNLFSILGGVPPQPAIRKGRLRAQGPFRHAILAGTVGAVCLPLMAGIWSKHRIAAIFGIISCLIIVYCSSSSGPLVSSFAGIAGLILWKYKDKMRLIRWGAVICYVILDIIMKAPAYFIMARIPLVPGSTGWHRAELIRSAIEHLNEWWLWGTDYTRHWMPTGVHWSKNHTDITNHYLQLGVIGGLPLMLLFIVIIVIAFSYVGKSIRNSPEDQDDERFMIWAIGSSLFANAATMISVSYFDQSFVFLYLTLAAIASIYNGHNSEKQQLDEANQMNS